MSKIPDCRTDDTYNEKYLSEDDSQFVLGYDFSIRDNITNFFNNLLVYEDELSMVLGLKEESLELDEHIIGGDKTVDEYLPAELENVNDVSKLLLTIKHCMLHWAEMNRDECITSLIDNMDDNEFEQNKADSDNGTYKNAIIRSREYTEKYTRGEVPTYWVYKKDSNGNMVKTGYCPNGDVIVKK